jgi:hypothetical protein
MELGSTLNAEIESLGSLLSPRSNTHATCCQPTQKSARNGEESPADFRCAVSRTTWYIRYSRMRFALSR